MWVHINTGRSFDNEDDLNDFISQNINTSDIEKAMQDFSSLTLFNNLTKEAQQEILNIAEVNFYKENIEEIP